MLAFVFSISFSSAYGQIINPLTIETDKKHYLQEETIFVSGSVDEILFGHEITLMVIAPNGNIVFINNPIVDSEKIFQTELIADSSSMNSSGVYTILAMYGSENFTAKTTFTIEQLTRTNLQDETLQNILLNFDFINPHKNSIQEHVDYQITVSKNGMPVFGPTPLTHSSTGSVSIPMKISVGHLHDVLIEVNGILFSSIPLENSSFSIMTNSENIQSKFTQNETLKINLAVDKAPFPDEKIIPEWIKNNAGWWAKGDIDDNSFVQGIQYMIKKELVDIPDLPYPAAWMDKSVPSWVKSNASWWADDLISEDDFIKGIKYLVEKGVIQI